MQTAPPNANPRAIFTRPRTFFTHAAFTLLELLAITVVIVIISLVVAVPALEKAKAKKQRIACVARLKNIGLAHRLTASNGGEHSPWSKLQEFRALSPSGQILYTYRTLSNELSMPKILACPSDTRKPAANWQSLTTNNVSYFLTLDAHESYPQTILAGDRNVIVNGQRVSGRVTITTNDLIAWDKTIHNRQGNTVMGDGSVQQLSTARLRNQITNTGLLTNTFLIP